MRANHAIALAMLLSIFSACSESQNIADLVSKHSEYESANEALFDRLVFRASPVKLNKSVTLKFVVRDQLDRDWLFKASHRGSSDGIVAVWRIYNLFGLDTPEAHYKTLVVNGRALEGTLQRFIPNLGGMTDDIFWSLTPEMADYFARSHLLDWLLANNQVYYQSFIVTADKEQRPQRVLRIDNAVNWHLMAHDKIDIDYATPWMRQFGKVGYLFFWRPFLQKSYPVRLDEILQLAHLISNFPDSEFARFFERGIAGGLERLANNDSGLNNGKWWHVPEVKPIQKSEFLPRILARKHSLHKDARRVYEELYTLRGEKFPPVGWDDAGVAARLTARLSTLLGEVKKTSAAIDAASPVKQQPLFLPLSIDAFEALRNLSGLVSLPREHRDRLFSETGQVLLRLLANKSMLPNERWALKNALRNLDKLRTIDQRSRAGEKNFSASFLTRDANKFFDSSWPELDSLYKKSGG